VRTVESGAATDFELALAAIGPLDTAAMEAARSRLDRLTKPPGSLGRLESLAIQLAGITGEPAARFDRRTLVVFAADHGVTARGVSAYPSSVTGQMVANFVAGVAAINALGRLARADVVVVDIGVAHPIPTAPARSGDRTRPGGRLVSRVVRPGTDDLSVGPAMGRHDALGAIGVGLELAAELAASGTTLVGVGEMGIGNTTAASALVAALTGRPASDVTGAGTGLDAAAWAAKVAVVDRAVGRRPRTDADPIDTLADLGGLEIAGLVGLIVGAAAARIPVVLDGFITGAAALVAVTLQPGLAHRLIAAHRSVEPGHAIVLDTLGLVPLLDLDLRLGEASGAALAFGLVDAATRIRDEMATFGEAGVDDRSHATAADIRPVANR
jgi:nicotinate-nucleotide--dimethylbenzimidazole phosphoribosyltransferase